MTLKNKSLHFSLQPFSMSKQKKISKQPPPPGLPIKQSEEKGNKLPEIILISLAVVFVIIGMYEIMTLGPSNGYWAVMLAMVFFFGYYIRKNKPK